jgi:hypothetical protein
MDNKKNNPSEIDVLSSLWQQQQVSSIDGHVMQTRWANTQLKQRCYFVLDFIGVLCMVGLFYLTSEKLGLFGKLWLFSLIILTLCFALYFSYLRRFALNWTNVSTGSHIEQLKLQFISNIRIATLNRQMTYWVPFAIILFYVGAYVFNEITLEKILQKSLISTVMLAVMCPMLWFWADKRATRFKKELAELEQVMFSQRIG